MREKYIKQVRKELAISSKKEKEIIRDLNEVFESALEHGETEQQVIERLGSPKDFADNIHEQLGNDCVARQKRKKLFHIAIAAVISVIAFIVSFSIKALRVPPNAIGQADAMTVIQVEGTAIDPMVIFMMLGIVALITVIALAVRYIRNK
mgnify:CR=1 FL=1